MVGIAGQLICVALLLVVTGSNGEWPDGTYGLPMSQQGCPNTDSFTWVEGSRLQETESGSHGSDPVHLAGIDTEKSNTILQKFCIKRTVSIDQDANHKFMPGSYCVYKKGDCPSGFQKGFIYWDDAASWFGSTKQTSSGVKPDGTYDRNTRIEYCCRADGLSTKPIKLPTASPFHLLKFGEKCQDVEDMEVEEEWVYWADENLLANLGNRGGRYPKITRVDFPEKFTRLYYCYYTPTGPNKTLKTAMTVIYVIAGVVGFVLAICLIMCIIQRIVHCHSNKKDDCDDNNTENTAREHMLNEVQTTDPPPIYRPAASSSTGSTSANSEDEPPKKLALRRDGPQIVSPPRYSTLPGAAPPVETPEDGEPYTAVLPDSRPMSHPPSYDEVLREDGKVS